MTSTKVVLLIVAALLLAVACRRATEPGNDNQMPSPTPMTATSPPDEFAEARALFLKNCVGCHGEDGTGGVKEVEGKKLKVPSFKEGHALKHTDEDFVKQIEKGGDGMPAFKDKLTPEQIEDLIDFIRRDIQGAQ